MFGRKKEAQNEETVETVETVETEIPEEEETAEETVEAQAEIVDEKQQALDAALKKQEEYLAMAQRLQAEFDNYRKRNATATSEARDDGTRQALTAMLAVLDNFERALDACEEGNAFKEGVELIFRQMKDAMVALGLEDVDTTVPFDPNVHHAVMQCPADEEHPSGTIVTVFQKGYSAKGRVIRAAMVQVAQ